MGAWRGGRVVLRVLEVKLRLMNKPRKMFDSELLPVEQDFWKETPIEQS